MFDIKNKINFIDVDDSVNSQKFAVKSVSEISVFGEQKYFHSFKSKMERISKGKSLQDKIKNKPKEIGLQKNFFVPVSSIRGHIYTEGNKMYKNDFFTILTKDSQAYTSNEVDKLKGMAFEFDSLLEANNFISYCKTDFARACLALLKTDNNLNSQMWLIPYMDFTQEWTDEKLYAHFNITEVEQAFIKEVIPPYYD